MQKISKRQLILWELQDEWRRSPIRKAARFFWAYTKLAYALRFCKKESSKLLDLDTEAMILMSPYQQRRYDIIITKVRSKIGDHAFPNYTLKKFFKDVCKKERSYDNTSEQRIMGFY